MPERSRRQTDDLGPLVPPEEDLVGRVFDNRYRILSLIGEGGIGAVYAAEHVHLRRRVAVKVLHASFANNAEFVARFEREALAASKATHPSCVAVLDLGSFDKRPYLVMEYVEGQVLTDHLAEHDVQPAEAAAIGLQILEALRHAHRHGIVHRDVKPDNIMLCQLEQTGTEVKLLDFGLAKNLVAGAPGSHTITQYGTIFGTPSYISPEQAMGIPADTRSDLYSLGVVLFQMVCGRKPFTFDDPIEQIQAHLTKPPPRARELRPDLSGQLEAVLVRAMEKDRNKRFQGADEFIEALRKVPEARGVPPAIREASMALAPAASAAPRAATVHVPGGSVTRQVAPRDLGPLLRVGLIALGALAAVALNVLASRWLPTYGDGELARRPAARKAHRKGSRAEKRAGHRRSRQPEPAPVPVSGPSPELRRAASLYAAGRLDAAEDMARRAVARRKRDGRAHLVLGHVFYAKLWFSDAIKEYGRAVKYEPDLRDDPTMLKYAIGCLRRGSVAPKAARFLVHKVGDAAIPALREAAKSHGDPDVRRRAARLLETLAGPQ